MLPLLLFACLKAPDLPVSTRSLSLGSDLRAELVTDGPIEHRLAQEDQADLVVYYMGNNEARSPRVDVRIDRGADYREQRAIEQSTPGLVLNAGYWMDDGQELMVNHGRTLS